MQIVSQSLINKYPNKIINIHHSFLPAFVGAKPYHSAFKRGVKNGLKILISTIPFFIIAGFLEGFVTRLTKMPDWLAIVIIASSLALILFYFVFYPRQLNKQIQDIQE